jgi:hypothetical protein
VSEPISIAASEPVSVYFPEVISANNASFCSDIAGCRACQNDIECYCEYSKTVVTIPCKKTLIRDSPGHLDFYNSTSESKKNITEEH